MMGSLVRRMVLLVAAGLSGGMVAGAQTPAPAAASVVTFAYDAVSIKPNKTGSNSQGVSSSPEMYKAENIPLKRLIQFAYNLFSDDQIAGIPGQLDRARFDVVAKVDAETVALLKKMSRDQRMETQHAMMRAMLADRFQLTMHRATKDASIYALVVAKGGAKTGTGLKQADPTRAETNAPPGTPGAYHQDSMSTSVDDNAGSMTGQSIKLDRLAEALSFRVNRLVFDRTGLTGSYDLMLSWTDDRDGQPVPEDAKVPNLFTALQEQLGLRLESTRGPVELVVVDHAAEPSEN
jgi:uncharacterized protein (TIGR03435 family)